MAIRGEASSAVHHFSAQDNSSDDEFITSAASLSQSEAHHRLLQKDMIHILGLPSAEDQPPCTSFKQHSAHQDSSVSVFPEFPVDFSCADTSKSVSEWKYWRPFPPRAPAYFQFPPNALPGFFTTP